MATFTWSALVFLVLQICLTKLIDCCIMKNNTFSPEYMVYDTKYILYGVVEGDKIQPDPRTPSVTTSYGVNFRIICIYKGDPNDPKLKEKEIVQIAGAGVVKDGCYGFEPDFTDPTMEYVIYLKEDGSHLVPSYGLPEVEQDLYELTINCGMIPKGPKGTAPSSECPSSQPADCVKYKVPTTPSPPVEVVPLSTTPAPAKEPTTKKMDVVKEPTKGGQETGDGNAASSLPVNVFLSLFLTLLSLLYLS